MTRWGTLALTTTLLALGACDSGDERPVPAGEADSIPREIVELNPAEEAALSREALEQGRLDTEWTEVVTLDTTGAGVAVRNPERWEQIDAPQVNRGPIFLPLGGDVAGPSVLRVQILLDRSFFSPGMMDGRWGKNTAKAVYFFQRREGLRASGRVDSATFQRLAQVAGSPESLVRAHRLSADDVAGPFQPLPDSIYELARLKCSCYESLSEKLSERFHVTTEVLALLNPGIELDALRAGATLQVPNVRGPEASADGQVARLVVSGRGSYVHAVDADGRILYHFPSTLGATYDPSPQGRFEIERVTRNPWWHYQPALLSNVPDDRPEAVIPPGPNSAVGVVWMALSVPHYGIHGTRAPETIGYASSSGCVRLTNWDALRLAGHVGAGTPVRFRDIRGRTESGAASAPSRRETEPRPRGESARDTLPAESARTDGPDARSG